MADNDHVDVHLFFTVVRNTVSKKIGEAQDAVKQLEQWMDHKGLPHLDGVVWCRRTCVCVM